MNDRRSSHYLCIMLLAQTFVLALGSLVRSVRFTRALGSHACTLGSLRLARSIRSRHFALT
jgi:hypothetical protein